MHVDELNVGRAVLVRAIQGGSFGDAFVDRLYAMGIVPNQRLVVLRRAPLSGPIVVRVGTTTEVAIRRSEAALIEVTELEQTKD